MFPIFTNKFQSPLSLQFGVGYVAVATLVTGLAALNCDWASRFSVVCLRETLYSSVVLMKWTVCSIIFAYSILDMERRPTLKYCTCVNESGVSLLHNKVKTNFAIIFQILKDGY